MQPQLVYIRNHLMMSNWRNNLRGRWLRQILLLALLLNLSGHFFFHLGDAPLHDEAIHFSSHSEQSGKAPLSHQCSVCQDHQTLALDIPSSASEPVEFTQINFLRAEEAGYDFQARQLRASRAPPRS